MYSLLIKNCTQLLTFRGQPPKRGAGQSDLGLIEDGFVAIEKGRIAAVGTMKDLDRKNVRKKTKVIDAKGRVVMPGLIDCHTHLIFAGDRAQEFQMRLAGKSYLDILAQGGGILSTVRATRQASEEHLTKAAIEHLIQMRNRGVTTVEIKSGYGLDLATELKMLRVMANLQKKQPTRIIRTFLGAHAIPPEYDGRGEDYLNFLMKKVLPKIKKQAEFVDIFCEDKTFTLEQTKRYLEAVKKMGFHLKIHSDQITRNGGSLLAHELGAVSFDHADQLEEEDLKKLSGTSSVAVLLPTAALFLKQKKIANGRAMIDANIPVAVASNFNPGSAPSSNLFLAMSLSCLTMELTIEEALTAVTSNAAAALGLQDLIGSLEVGKQADVVLLDSEDYRKIPYLMGEVPVQAVIIRGKVIE